MQRGYYAVIPAEIRYDKNLPANAKLLYGELTALASDKGYCWAQNRYFSELYGVSAQTINNWLNALKKGGYISTEVVYKEGTHEVEKRYIRIACLSGEEEIQEEPSSKNLEGVSKKTLVPSPKKLGEPPQKNFKDNNTVNITVNNTRERERRESNPELVKRLYNEICKSLPSVISMTESRKRASKLRVKELGIENVKSLFTKAEASDFLKGKNERNWKANFDWLMKPANATKVLEGNYDNAKPKAESYITEEESLAQFLGGTL